MPSISKLPTAEQLLVGLILVLLAAVILLNVLVRPLRRIARRPAVVHWAWHRTRPDSLASRGRRLLPALACDGLALVLVRLATRQLCVRAFDAPKGINGDAVSAALSAAMTRIASSRDSGVDTVTAPIEAETTVEAVAAGVKAVPAGGELAAALVHLTASLLAPGELQLSGQLLPPDEGGPGLALTLATARGRVRERLTIRACQFEPTVGADGQPAEEADRLTRLATAGAVWTHFQMLEGEWHLSPHDLRLSLRTSSWFSYALMRVGIENEERQGPTVARALYAKAVDVDTSNLIAQFNLASTELRDAELGQVSLAAEKRLEYVHDKLEAKSPGAGHAHKLMPRPSDESLLLRDPLCYQVCYKRIAAQLNADVAVEEKYERGRLGRRLPEVPTCASWLEDGTGAPCCRRPVERIENVGLDRQFLENVARHVRDLELTLNLLHSPEKQWRMAGTKPWRSRAAVLSAIEGPMLALWAMIALRVGDSNGCFWTPHELWIAEDQWSFGGRKARQRVVELIESGEMTPAIAIARARGADVLRRSRTRFSLACWFADLGRLGEGLRELELSVEGGGEKARRRMCDPQLRHLDNGAHEKEWKTLLSRYEPSQPIAAQAVVDAAQAAANGSRRGALNISLEY
ncbi:MAG TPA: hypothetical protein VNU28_05005 [Solirubrobacteraceae bacterium]|jgi:hypothetical protein|nr:hypothetical protein [Solirubrobacteraceae bacterium]